MSILNLKEGQIITITSETEPFETIEVIRIVEGNQIVDVVKKFAGFDYFKTDEDYSKRINNWINQEWVEFKLLNGISKSSNSTFYERKAELIANIII